MVPELCDLGESLLFSGCTGRGDPAADFREPQQLLALGAVLGAHTQVTVWEM